MKNHDLGGQRPDTIEARRQRVLGALEFAQEATVAYLAADLGLSRSIVDSDLRVLRDRERVTEAGWMPRLGGQRGAVARIWKAVGS